MLSQGHMPVSPAGYHLHVPEVMVGVSMGLVGVSMGLVGAS